MKLQFSFISTDIIANLAFDMSLLPIAVVGVFVIVRVIVYIGRRHI